MDSKVLHADNRIRLSLICTQSPLFTCPWTVHWLSPLKRNCFRLKVTVPNLQTLDHFLSHRLCPKICRNLSRILSFITSKCLSITKKLCQSSLLPFILNRQSQFLWRGPRKETVLAVCSCLG